MKFLRNEDGAVTVDWVVLAGALVLLAGTVVLAVGTSLENAAGNIETEVTDKIQNPGGSTGGESESLGPL